MLKTHWSCGKIGFPRRAAILAAMQSAIRAARGPVDALGIRRVHGQAVKHAPARGLARQLRPSLAAILRLEDPASALPVLRVAIEAEIDDLRILRIDRQRARMADAPHRIGAQDGLRQARLDDLISLPGVIAADDARRVFHIPRAAGGDDPVDAVEVIDRQPPVMADEFRKVFRRPKLTPILAAVFR